MEKAVCFTGYRPQKLPYKEGSSDYCKLKDVVCEILNDLIEKEGYRKFICGMAEGVDMFCGELVLMFKKMYPNILLESAIPHPEQSQKWEQYSKDRYERIKSESDKITMVIPHYTRDCMLKRAIWLIIHLF